MAPPSSGFTSTQLAAGQFHGPAASADPDFRVPTSPDQNRRDGYVSLPAAHMRPMWEQTVEQIGNSQAAEVPPSLRVLSVTFTQRDAAPSQ